MDLGGDELDSEVTGDESSLATKSCHGVRRSTRTDRPFWRNQREWTTERHLGLGWHDLDPVEDNLNWYEDEVFTDGPPFVIANPSRAPCSQLKNAEAADFHVAFVSHNINDEVLRTEECGDYATENDS